MTRLIDADTFESMGTGPQSLDERLATLAHDLRTPLGSIKLWGGLLRSGKVAAIDVPRAIESILTAADEQEQLIEQLLATADFGGAAELDESSDQSAALELSPANPPQLGPLAGVTVLLAEDDAKTRVAMQLTLAQAGACVLAAESADTALALAQAADLPDVRLVLVSDLSMRGTSGYELVAELGVRRRRHERPLIPACAVGAPLHASEQQRALDAGFDIFLAKPFTPQQLTSAVAVLSQVGPDGAGAAELE